MSPGLTIFSWDSPKFSEMFSGLIQLNRYKVSLQVLYNVYEFFSYICYCNFPVFLIRFVDFLNYLIFLLLQKQLHLWTEQTQTYTVKPAGVQISGLPVAHGNQNVTWATWKCRKIAQLAIKNSSSPVSLNYRLSVCIVIVFLLPVQLKCF